KPVWATLQIAWSGVLPPAHVPRFPTLLEERFMAYQAIVAGARGLAFFGGHLTQLMRPADVQSGWNWAFWERVLKPRITEPGSAGPGLDSLSGLSRDWSRRGDVSVAGSAVRPPTCRARVLPRSPDR